jgi:hypothetical protein
MCYNIESKILPFYVEMKKGSSFVHLLGRAFARNNNIG